MFGLLAEKVYAQLIKEDTRHRGEQKGCLDHIYTRQIKHVAEIFNENVHGWDHNSVGVKLRTDRPVFRRKVIVKRDYDKVDPDEFHRVWTQSIPDEIFETDGVEIMIDILEFKIKHCLDIVCPEKRFLSSENYAPWVDKQLKKKAESTWKEWYLNFEDEKQGWQRLKQVSSLSDGSAKKISLIIDDELVDDPEFCPATSTSTSLTRSTRSLMSFPLNW